jgi:tyrosine-protein kinase Etk/Wzc
MGHDLVPAVPELPRADALGHLARGQVITSADREPEEEPLQIGRYVSAIVRYKWLILLILAVGTALSVAATRFVHPKYQAQATIWIASETPQGRNAGPFRAEELVNASAWPDLLTSFAILDSVVLKVGLYVRPDRRADAPHFANFALADRFLPGSYVYEVTSATRQYTLATDQGAIVERGAVGDSVGRKLGFKWLPPAALGVDKEVKFTVVTPRTASLALRQNMTALPPRANLMRIQVDGEDAERTAVTTNALLRQFVTTAASLKNRNLLEFAHTLEQQLNYAQTQLRDAEFALQSFRVNTITLPSEGGPVASGLQLTRDPVLTSYFGQKIDYDNVVHDRGLLEQMLGELKTGTLDISSLWFVNAVQNGPPELRNALTEYATKSASLRAARQVFTDEHRNVRELEATLRQLREQTIPQLGNALVAQLRERELALSQRIGSAGKELQQIPARTIEEMRLTRNVAVRENLYTTLKNRYEEARLSGASAIPDVSVLDSAVTPQSPSTNSAPRIVALGVLGSLGLAFLLALGLDRFDTRFRYPDQVSRELRLDILGVVPTMEGEIKSVQGAAQVIESFRSIRLGLVHAFASGGTPMVTVTSPGPGDGKSIVCANLAISFASGGYRTLLIDGDIRRGALHTTLGVTRTPGLTDVLLGTATIGHAIRPTETQRLWLLPSGTRRIGDPELLTSHRLLKLMDELRTGFDVVIVDSAPLGAGIDGFALASATRNLVLVMRTGKTDRKLAEAKLRVMDRLPVNVLGAVLNGVRSDGVYRYYGYTTGYALDEHDPPVAVVGAGD